MTGNLDELNKLNKNFESNINNNQKYILLDDINDIITMQNNNIEIKFDNIKNKYFKKHIFKKITVTGDGNYLYRCISVNKFGDETKYENIRNLTYNYIFSNENIIYDFCYLENNLLYLNVEHNNQIIKFTINENINNIKEDGFYGGFIEIYALSKIYSQPITVININIF